jgi:hypothetical protein
MSSAYIKFARDNRHLYEVMMSLHAPEHDATFHQSLWTFTVEQVQRVAGASRAAEASVALWAFLHGAVALEKPLKCSASANLQAASNAGSTRG